MSETHLTPTIHPVEPTAPLERRTITRRAFLSLITGSAAAVMLSACSEDATDEHGELEYYPDGGFPSDPSWLNESPSTSPTAAAESSPSRTPKREKPEVAGKRIDGIAWDSQENTRLATEIRRMGIDIARSPAAETVDDPEYLERAAVVGVRAKDVPGETLHVVLVAQDPSARYADKVFFTRIPRKDDKGDSQIPAVVSVEDGSRVYPYRVAIGAVDYTVAFVTGTIVPTQEGKKPSWTAEKTYLLNPGVSVTNSTYSNAPLIA